MRAIPLLLWLAGCSTAPDPASEDLSGSPEDLATPDLAGGAVDLAGADLTGSAADLAGADLGAPADLGSSDGPLFPADKGQCYTSAQCGGNGLTCRVNAPGGICAGCVNNAAICPGTFNDSCFVDACLRDCAASSECLPGQTCAGGGGNMHCALTTCTNNGGCPSIYECRVLPGAGAGSTMYCQRFLCAGGGACPAGTECKATGQASLSDVCVEKHLTF